MNNEGGTAYFLNHVYTINSSSKLLETPRLDAVITVRNQETRQYGLETL